MSSDNSTEHPDVSEPQPIDDDALEFATGGIILSSNPTQTFTSNGANYGLNTSIYFQ